MVIVISKEYKIAGDPVPLARPRASLTCKMWDAQKQVKLARGLQLRNQHGDLPFFNGPLHIDATFYFEPPKKKDLGSLHVYKPDLSNLVKFLEDIATGVLYKDDCLIASTSAKKCYADQAATVFTIKQLT